MPKYDGVSEALRYVVVTINPCNLGGEGETITKQAMNVTHIHITKKCRKVIF